MALLSAKEAKEISSRKAKEIREAKFAELESNPHFRGIIDSIQTQCSKGHIYCEVAVRREDASEFFGYLSYMGYQVIEPKWDCDVKIVSVYW